MRKLAFHLVLLPLVALSFYGCDEESPLAPSDAAVVPTDLDVTASPLLASTRQAPGGGAYVINHGNGKGGVYCHMGSLVATKGSAVITPSGNATLSCHFEGLAPVDRTYRSTGFGCYLNTGGHYKTTNNTSWIRTRSGQAKLTCQFR